jgi:hypothetical protein
MLHEIDTVIVGGGQAVLPNYRIVLQWYYNRDNNEVVECAVLHKNNNK